MLDKQPGNRFPVLIADGRPSSSFYSRIRSAAILLKLHGLFPFEKLRSDDGRALSFKWFGWNASWGFLLYAVISIVLGRLSFDKNANRMTLYGYITQSWIYYICYSANCRKFLAALAALETVNDKFARFADNVHVTRTRGGPFWIVFEICMFGLYGTLEVAFFLSRGKRMPGSTFWMAVLPVVVVCLLEIYISMLYLLTASQIQLYYELLNHRLGESVRSLIMRADVLEEFEYERILHTDLADACDLLQNWFGPTFFCISSMSIVKTLLKLYQILFVNGHISFVNDFLPLILIFGYQFVLTSTSQNLANSLRLAILQATTLAINTKAVGLFATTHSLLPWMLSVIVVYLSVVIELEQPLEVFAKMLKSTTTG